MWALGRTRVAASRVRLLTAGEAAIGAIKTANWQILSGRASLPAAYTVSNLQNRYGFSLPMVNPA